MKALHLFVILNIWYRIRVKLATQIPRYIKVRIHNATWEKKYRYLDGWRTKILEEDGVLSLGDAPSAIRSGMNRIDAG